MDVRLPDPGHDIAGALRVEGRGLGPLGPGRPAGARMQAAPGLQPPGADFGAEEPGSGPPDHSASSCLLPFPGVVAVDRLHQVRHAVDDGSFVENDGRLAIDAILNGLHQPDRDALGRRNAGIVELLDPTERLRPRGFQGSWKAFG